MVYYLSWKPDEMPCLPSDWQQYLPAYRIEKALSYKHEKDRATSVFAFLLLRYALYKEYARTAMLQIKTDANGKPFAQNGEYHFNLSHCKTAVACAFDATPIGVDVQEFCPVHENVVKKVCTPAEQQRLLPNGNDEKLFAAFWAGKESFGKCKGDGIGYDLKIHAFCPESQFPQKVQFENLWIQTDLYDSFALSVCACEQQQIAAVSYDKLMDFLAVLDEKGAGK